jgi:uncharacterized protein (DUF849 family)
MSKTIITAALTGAVTPKSINPNIPLTPKEIAEDAIRVWKEGAAVVHLHMRDDNGLGCMDVSKFRETVRLIRENTDLVINVTTSGGPTPDDESRFAHVLELQPEMCSFDAGSFNWLPGGPFMNTAEFLRKLGKACIETGTKPEIEVFDTGMINAAVYFMEQEHVLNAPLHFQFVLGVKGMAKAEPGVVTHMHQMLPQGSTWSALGIGSGHLPVMYTAIALGGNVRVGLEDNVYYRKGELATNSQLVARAARVIREFNSEVATPDDAREILGLRKCR